MSSKASLATSDNHDIPVNKLTTVVEDVLHETEVGYDIYVEAREGLEYDPVEEKQVLRKIDYWILPAFCMTQGLAFLDKTALNYGNLFGMQKYVCCLFMLLETLTFGTEIYILTEINSYVQCLLNTMSPLF